MVLCSLQPKDFIAHSRASLPLVGASHLLNGSQVPPSCHRCHQTAAAYHLWVALLKHGAGQILQSAPVFDLYAAAISPFFTPSLHFPPPRPPQNPSPTFDPCPEGSFISFAESHRTLRYPKSSDPSFPPSYQLPRAG